MALSLGRRKLRGEAGGRGCRSRHFHVHYHLPPRRAGDFSLRRWFPRLSLLSCLLFPLVLFLAVIAFVLSFVWFTLLYFVASLWNKDGGHGSFRNRSFGRASGDVDNYLREEDGQEGKRQAKGKALKHSAELLAGDSATSDAGAKKLEIKEVHVDGFSDVSRNITRIASSDASINCEVRTNNDGVVENLSIFEIGREGFSRIHELQGVPVDGFGDEHNIRVVSSSTSGDSLPSVYSINSARIHDVPDMNKLIEMSPDFLVGSNQNTVVPSNTSPPLDVSDTNEEYGEELFEDRKPLSDCTPCGILDFIDKHETRDEELDGSFSHDEKIGLLTSSDGSAHGRIPVPDEHYRESAEENDEESVPEFIIDGVASLEVFDEQRVPEVPITEADKEQSTAPVNEVHDLSNEDETSAVPLYSVCEDKDSSDDSSHKYNGHEDDKQVEANVSSIFDSATQAADSVACDFVENSQTATTTQAQDDSSNGGSTRGKASQNCSEDEDQKVNDNSSSEGARRGWPLLRRSRSQWWQLCGVVDVFAGSED